jgi:hypothetical protein
MMTMTLMVTLTNAHRTYHHPPQVMMNTLTPKPLDDFELSTSTNDEYPDKCGRARDREGARDV